MLFTDRTLRFELCTSQSLCFRRLPLVPPVASNLLQVQHRKRCSAQVPNQRTFQSPPQSPCVRKTSFVVLQETNLLLRLAVCTGEEGTVGRRRGKEVVEASERPNRFFLKSALAVDFFLGLCCNIQDCLKYINLTVFI